MTQSLIEQYQTDDTWEKERQRPQCDKDLNEMQK